MFVQTYNLKMNFVTAISCVTRPITLLHASLSAIHTSSFEHPISCYTSRHTIVCRAAQEAGAPHREYINRKKENAIFTPM